VLRGMEFKNVYLINCNEENIPHVNSIDNNLEEERRLFYVGITRAIDNVWLCICKNVKGKAKETSWFIKECNIKTRAFLTFCFNNHYLNKFNVKIHLVDSKKKIVYKEDEFKKE